MAADLPPPLDVDRITGTFARHAVDFVVIGGIAVLAHGHPRTTFDVDFVADLAEENMTRLAAALQDLDARVRGVDADLSRSTRPTRSSSPRASHDAFQNPSAATTTP